MSTKLIGCPRARGYLTSPMLSFAAESPGGGVGTKIYEMSELLWLRNVETYNLC